MVTVDWTTRIRNLDLRSHDYKTVNATKVRGVPLESRLALTQFCRNLDLDDVLLFTSTDAAVLTS